ncbi:MAG: biotin/lipoyl-binding protein [Planctomycetia bacterium]|nr:biotin/lipoyl-binding protein [Planctomycetia bacterium]
MARKSFFFIMTAAVAVLCLITTACKKQEAAQQDQAKAMPPALVTAEKAEADFPEVTKKYVGVFEAIDSVDVVARVAGRIIEVNVQEGLNVEAGKQLFKIEDVIYKANVSAAKANLATCEANIISSAANLESAKASVVQLKARLTYAATSYMRLARLYCGKNEKLEEIFKVLSPESTCDILRDVVAKVDVLVNQISVPAAAASKDEYEKAASDVKSAIAALESGRSAELAAQGTLDSAKAARDAAQAKLDLAVIDDGYTIVTSDISGRAGRLKHTLGNYVTPASGALITVTQMDPIYVRFSMSEQDFAEMFNGRIDELMNSADLAIEFAGQEKDGKPILFPVKMNENGQNILFIDNSVRTNMDSVYIWATFDNKDQIFNPGGICRVIMKRRLPEKCAFVRSTAIQHDASGTFLYVVGDGNIVERRVVTLGPARGSYQAIMPNDDPKKTLQAGEVVATSGTHKIVMIPGVETRVNLALPSGAKPEDSPLSVVGVVGGAEAPIAPQASTAAKFDADGREVAKAEKKAEKKAEVEVVTEVEAEALPEVVPVENADAESIATPTEK